MPQHGSIDPPPCNDSASSPEKEEVQRQLHRILNSPEFQATPSQRQFLQFVVSETIAGRSHEIKGYTVATRVFGRSADFDPNLDPIVSIQANKLRRALERYYLTAGRNDPIRIDIPIGAYVPTFHEHEQAEAASAGTALSGGIPDYGFYRSGPTLLVRPFQNMSGDTEQNYLGIGLATELSVELSRFQEIQVLMVDPGRRAEKVPASVARFVLDGSYRADKQGIRATVQLFDTTTGRQIWGDRYACVEGSQITFFEEEVARAVAAKIASEYGIIAKTLSVELKHSPPSDLKTYDAILRYYNFNADFSSDTFSSAYEALKLATAREPECGLVWSMRGRLYAVNYSLELFDPETPLREAASFAERGAWLDPNDQRTHVILAYILLFKNEVAAGLAEVDKALALNPQSIIFLENIGYLMTLLGDWKRGPALIGAAIKANPFYNVVAHYALWVDWVRQADYERAYLETLNFRTPLLFWDPLLKAAALGQLRRLEEGRRAVEELLKLKPDFANRGRLLIGHYIKFEEILERIIAGLRQCGLQLA